MCLLQPGTSPAYLHHSDMKAAVGCCAAHEHDMLSAASRAVDTSSLELECVKCILFIFARLVHHRRISTTAQIMAAGPCCVHLLDFASCALHVQDTEA